MTCGKTMETKVALFQIFGTNVANYRKIKIYKFEAKWIVPNHFLY